MLRIWSRSPFLRIGLPFIFGILLQALLPANAIYSSCLLIVITTITVVIHVKKKLSGMNQRWIQGTLLSFNLFVLGYWLAVVSNPSLHPFHYLHRNSEQKTFLLRVCDAPVLGKGGVRFPADIIYSGDSVGDLFPTTGRVMMFFYSDSTALNLKADDVIAVSGKLMDPSEPKHPFGFDYKKYLAGKGIFKILSPKTGMWKVVPELFSPTFKGRMVQIRENMIHLMDDFNIPNEERGVLAALIWGKASEIDADIMSSYSRAGVVHVLAVSGLHVGLVYAVLTPVMNRFFGKRKRKWIRFLVPALILWVYAGLTGFSPSVLRAAVMFTGFIIAEEFGKSKESFNTLMSSAFVLLVFDPIMLFNIGFQLSYLAVLGIMTLQKPLLSLYYSRHYLLREIWKMCAVSIAAQIITMPLCLYYFHQFPTYFLFANILVIPISTVILYAGLLFFACHWFQPLAWLSINLATAFTHWMNMIIGFFDKLPMALIERIGVSFFGMVLLYLFVFGFFQWWVRQKQVAFYVCLVSLGLYGVDSYCIKANKWRQNEVAVHSLGGEIQLSVRSGDQVEVYSKNDTELFEKELTSMLVENRVQSIRRMAIDSTADIINVSVGERRVQFQFIKKETRFIYPEAILIFPKSQSRSYFKFTNAKDWKGPMVILEKGYSKRKQDFLIKTLNTDRSKVVGKFGSLIVE
jgi:competence protein ComEC